MIICAVIVLAILFAVARSQPCVEQSMAYCLANAETLMIASIDNNTFNYNDTCCMAHHFLECIKQKSVECPAVDYEGYKRYVIIQWTRMHNNMCGRYKSLSEACNQNVLTTYAGIET